MLVKHETRNRVIIFTFTRERLGYTEEVELRQELWQATEGAQAPKVLIDLEDVAYVTSGPLGIFLAFHDRVERAGGDLRFCSLSPYVEETFRASRLRRMLATFPTRQAALASWQ